MEIIKVKLFFGAEVIDIVNEGLAILFFFSLPQKKLGPITLPSFSFLQNAVLCFSLLPCPTTAG